MASPELYYKEFLRYSWMAARQQASCNLGTNPYKGSVADPLMEHVELYDVVERKYAGFSALVNDCFYGWSPEHPYWKKMEAGMASEQRKMIAPLWNGVRDRWPLENWLYLFLVHRLTGSAINYAQKPSGYHNTIVPSFFEAETIEDMGDILLAGSIAGPIFTSIGYQFPAFPKPPNGYRSGGVYFMRKMLPQLARMLARYLQACRLKPTLRELGDVMFEWNESHGLRKYKFQYAAFIADVADWFPELVDRESPFYYGSNAVECISYLTGGKKSERDLDAMMLRIYEDTGSLPYNAEDVCCDFIRWVENYVRPGDAYGHLDRDEVFSSHDIADHPYGRQKPMLELGLIDSFNSLTIHPSDDYILRQAGWTVEQYREAVKERK